MSSQVSPAFRDVHHATANTHLNHPAQSATARTTSSTQLFLGFNALAVGMMGQANQHHIASTAVTLPRQSHLASRRSRGGCWGPAVHPPFLPHGPSLSHCIYISPNLNGADMQMVCLRVKIYPPVPPTNLRVSYLNRNLAVFL